MYAKKSQCQKCRNSACGFTLLEVLVALAIVATALGASLRAVGSLTRNSTDLRIALLSAWSAENRFVHHRLRNEWPSIGGHLFNCPQGELQLVCWEKVIVTPNPDLRRVEISVFDGAGGEHRIIKLMQVLPNEK